MSGEGTRVQVANPGRLPWWLRAAMALVLWSVFAGPVIGALGVVRYVRGIAAALPDVPDLAAWRNQAAQSSTVVALDGTVVAELPFSDHGQIGYRELVSWHQLPEVLVAAVLAAEDVRFASHRGVDLRAVARAAWANLRAERYVQGASTITQQVARNLLPAEIGHQQTIDRKVREALLARRIESRWSKRDLLEVYLNLVFLGDDNYGVAAAARRYFDRRLDQLSLGEAALLAGLIQAPSRLDPTVDPASARQRRDEVLARMQRAGFLDQAARTAAAAAPIVLRQQGRPVIAPWFVEQVRRAAAPRLDTGGGWTFETALLPAAAADAAARAAAHVVSLAPSAPPQVASLFWDHRTGYVEVAVGGRDWQDSQFDRTIQACRQPGSAFKPIVYLAALAAGVITLATPLRDAPISEYDEASGRHWKPKSGQRFRGTVLAIDALASSLNAPAIDVFDRVGGAKVVSLAHHLGFTTAISEQRPVALGASCVKLYELARAFAVIARGGWASQPRWLLAARRGDQRDDDVRVPEDPWLSAAARLDRLAAVTGAEPDGRLSVGDGEPLLDPRDAFLADQMLGSVVERGTASAARTLGRPVAGKTGTTNDNTDAWFVGYSARVVGAVWIGHDDPAVRLTSAQDGGRAALPLWIALVRGLEGSRPARPRHDAAPGGLVEVRIDRDSGRPATSGGPGIALWFKNGSEPVGEAEGDRPDLSRSSSEF